MQFKTAKFQIGGRTYEATKLGAVTGRKLWLRLVKVLSHLLPVLGDVQKALAAGDDAKLSPELIEKIPGVLENLSEQDLEIFWSAYCANLWLLTPSGRMALTEDLFDVHFSGDYVSMMKLFVELTKFNFGASFLGPSGPAGSAEAPANSAP
jgi:hypothetical protein